MDCVINGCRDICKTLEFIERIRTNGRQYVDFSSYSPCYKFSNENLVGYYSKFNIKDGRVLTVCGSGDQVLSAILYGAKSVDCFDSNCVAYYNMMLKMYAVKYLSYNEFLDFFGISGRKVCKKDIYDSFKKSIKNKDVRIFFDILFEDEVCFNYLYNLDDDEIQDLFSNIPYLNRDNYNKLKGRIDECPVSFKATDLFNVFSSFDGNYDFINLSNIYDYVDNMIKFCVFIDGIKSNNLTNKGGIMINYSWDKPHYRSSINEAALNIGAYQASVPSCHYNINVDSDSIMYCGNIRK